MNISRRKTLFAGMLGLPLASIFTRVGFSQQRAEKREESASPDAPFAACLLIDGRKQIGKCELVRKRLSSEEAIAFAQAEIEEHEALATKLQHLGFSYPVDGKQAGVGAGPNAIIRSDPNQVKIGIGTLTPGVAQMIITEHEIATHCLATFKEITKRKENARLDRAYLGDQLYSHYCLWDKAQVFKKQTSPEMTRILEDALAIIQKHLTALEGMLA